MTTCLVKNCVFPALVQIWPQNVSKLTFLVVHQSSSFPPKEAECIFLSNSQKCGHQTGLMAMTCDQSMVYPLTQSHYFRKLSERGEGVVRRNGRPKGCFWRVHFFSAPFKFSDVLRASLKGAEKKRTLQKHPFGRPFLRTTPSPLLWRTPKMV